MTLIHWPEMAGDEAALGGKARALRRAMAAGLPVPAWFVLSPGALEERLSGAAPEAWEAAVHAYAPDTGVDSALEEALAWLCPDGRAVAVRSSGREEDGQAHSFAGQFESVLWVDPRDRGAIWDAIRTVWASGFSQRVTAYRQERGLAEGSRSPAAPATMVPAVLIQRMVNAEVAGVAFSADPVSGRRRVAVVAAVIGLGSQLVNGEGDADTFRVDREGKVIERAIAAKQRAHRPREGGGVVTAEVPADQAGRPALDDALAVQVAALARAAASAFGRAQDIEWAFEAGQLFLLQSRPITSLGALPDPDGIALIWDNSNIAESYNGVTTPLTFTFARHAYEHVYRQFCRLMGVSPGVIADHSVTFSNMIGIIRGRVYYNLLNWYRVLAMLPGFAFNRRFMEQMMGVKEGLPAEIAAELAGAGWRARMSDALRLGRTIIGLVFQHFTLQGSIARFNDRLRSALADPPTPLESMGMDELAAHFRELERRLLTRWDAPLVNDFFAMIFYGALRAVCAKWCGDPDGTLANNLVCGQGGIISAEPPVLIRQMARLVAARSRQDPALLDALCTADAATIRRCLGSDAELAGLYGSYLRRFGDRCLEELKLESPTLHDDPLPLFRSIGQMARRLAGQQGGTAADDAARTAVIRAAAEERVRSRLRGHPLRGVLFWWVLTHAGRRVRDRENLRFERTRLFGRVRRVMVEIGRRLWEAGRLEEPRDVFFLHLDEVLGWIEGAGTMVDLRAVAAARRQAFAGFREAGADAPDGRFITRGAVNLGNRFRSAAGPAAPPSGAAPGGSAPGGPEADTRRGTGCCPGVVRGPVRVITDPREAAIESGEILVASRTDPGWVLLFPAASGVLVEHGSLLSHSAIVARELGIPAVVGVPGLTAWLRTGDTVELDGATGQIRRIAPPADGPLTGGPPPGGLPSGGAA